MAASAIGVITIGKRRAFFNQRAFRDNFRMADHSTMTGALILRYGLLVGCVASFHAADELQEFDARYHDISDGLRRTLP